MVYLFLMAHFFLKINVVGIDEVSEQQKLFLKHNKYNKDKNIQMQMLEIRLKNNEIMKNNIENHLNKGNDKYIIVGGLMHYELARMLNIKNILVFDKAFVKNDGKRSINYT